MIVSEKVILRAWCSEDINSIKNIRNDTHLQGMLMSQPKPSSYDRVTDWLRTKSENTDEIFFIIADRQSDQAIGYLQIVNIKHLHGTAELGICISPDMQSKGYGKSAILGIEDYLQNIFNIRKLVLFVLKDNTDAFSFYIRLGFLEAGLLKKHFYLNKEYKDVIIMDKLLTQ